MKWLIVTGGTAPESALLHERVQMAQRIIAVDGAADQLARESITPHVLIGDFDTALKASVDALAARGAQVVRLPVQKNMTDTEAAMDYALDAGADDITILGALGTRTDHTLSNIGMLLRAYHRGAACRIIDDTNELEVATGEYTLTGRPGQTVSILPLTGDLVVTASGLEYPLEALSLPFGSSRGVSNRMKEDSARLSISGGIALIVRIRKTRNISRGISV
jgi:thiamine pyrophosphokinase